MRSTKCMRSCISVSGAVSWISRATIGARWGPVVPCWSPMARANCSTVGDSNSTFSANCKPSSRLSCATKRAARSECPPKTKKSSFAPMPDILSTDCIAFATQRSSSVRGGSLVTAAPEAVGSGVGSAFLSIFPFGSKGIAFNAITCWGIM